MKCVSVGWRGPDGILCSGTRREFRLSQLDGAAESLRDFRYGSRPRHAGHVHDGVAKSSLSICTSALAIVLQAGDEETGSGDESKQQMSHIGEQGHQ